MKIALWRWIESTSLNIYFPSDKLAKGGLIDRIYKSEVCIYAQNYYFIIAISF